MTYFTTFVLSSREIEDVNFYIYRDYSTNKIVKKIVLKTPERKIQIYHRQARTQLYKVLGIKRDIEKIKDWRVRNKILKRAFEERARKELEGKCRTLMFRCIIDGDRTVCWSVVTSEYVEIPIPVVKEIVSNTLADFNCHARIERSWKTSKSRYYLYRIEKIGERRERITDIPIGSPIDCGFLLRVGFSGDRSIGVYGFWRILACSNGLVANEPVGRLRIVHRRIDIEQVGRQIREFISKVMQERFKIKPLIENAISREITPEIQREIQKILAKYPEHVRNKFKNVYLPKYRNERGIFKYVQALSDLANHRDITERYRLMLQKDSYKILCLVERR